MAKAYRTHWDERAGAAANARRELARLAGQYFARMRRELEKQPAPKDLHRMRLATKRFRYTLELFRPCYGPALDRRLAALRTVQQVLGEVNDSVATARLLPKPAKARAWLERRTAEKAGEFRKHWTETFDAPGQEALWIRYLERNARSR